MLENHLSDVFDRSMGIGTILYTGVGDGPALEACLGSGAEKIVLILGDAEEATELGLRFREDGRVTVLHGAISRAKDNLTSYVFDYPELNAFHAPSGILKLFPGAKLIGEGKVPVLTPALFAPYLEMSLERANFLICGVPGQGEDCLGALSDQALLDGFTTVLLRTAGKPLYEGGDSLETVKAALKEGRFTLGLHLLGSDPDWPWLCVARDDRSRLAQAQEQLVGLKEASIERQAMERKLERTEAQLATLRERHEVMTLACEEARGQVRILQGRQVEQVERYSLMSTARDEARVQVSILRARLEKQERDQQALEERLKVLSEKEQKAKAYHSMSQEMLRAQGQIKILQDLYLKDGRK